MKCLILSGGTPPDQDVLLRHVQSADYIIGVDGAAEKLLRCGIVPHVLIGDFDTADAMSVSSLEHQGAGVIRLQPEKNETDTEAAVNHAVEAGADDITILGATGRRMDHTLSNIMMLVRADMAGASACIIDHYNELRAAHDEFTLKGQAGQTISILPLTGELWVNADDLKYPLKNLHLRFGSSRGVSNVMLKNSAKIRISGGYALIAKSLIKA